MTLPKTIYRRMPYSALLVGRDRLGDIIYVQRMDRGCASTELLGVCCDLETAKRWIDGWLQKPK